MTVKTMANALSEFKNGKYAQNASQLSQSMKNEDGIQEIARIVTSNLS